MVSLKSLSFSSLVGVADDPVTNRRSKLVARLEEQKSLLSDPLHMRSEHHFVIQPSGIKERVEVRKRVRPWWRVDDKGKIYLTVRYGAKSIEFEKGKHAIVVDDKSELASVLDLLIEATRAGELDAHLARSARARGGARRAA